MKRGIPQYLAFLFFFFPLVSFSQEEAIKLAEGVYAIKGPGAAMNTGFVVGDRGVASWSPASVVPGHGAFAAGNGTKPLLDQDRYFETMRNRVRAMRDAGKSVEEIKNGIRAELGEFARWPRERAIPATAEQIYRELSAR